MSQKKSVSEATSSSGNSGESGEQQYITDTTIYSDDSVAANNRPTSDRPTKKINRFPDDPEFNEIFQNCEAAIVDGILPSLISQGSSGSYFVYDTNKVIRAVFKPKDEEPYGPMNPKWAKYVQRTCSPCCFGRSCLIPNQGYLSEAGASVVDSYLRLNIVPITKVVRLRALSFNYKSGQKFRGRIKDSMANKMPDTARKLHIQPGLPSKIGSFQLFVQNYKEAYNWLKKWETDPEYSLTDEVKIQFRLKFEKLVILDYIIRNTDRGMQNWLIKYEPDSGYVDIAAIDNGLSFPFKHPDRWRTYPYSWLQLPVARTKFSEETVKSILPTLDDANSVAVLCKNLLAVFRRDSSFNRRLAENQLNVVRGQIDNLRVALQRRMTPLELVNLPPKLMLKRRKKRTHWQNMTHRFAFRREESDVQGSNWDEKFVEKSVKTQAKFTGC